MTLRPARFLDSIAQIDAQSWNALAGTTQPFLRHEFLLALEQSGCAAPRTGWAPQHLVMDDAKGVPTAALPMFLKAHSRGEFVFDFSWAGAYAQQGLKYYPKLLTAVPFTPVTGPRLLMDPNLDAKATTIQAIRAVLDYARHQHLSSWHVLFPTEDSAARFDQAGLILRRDCQFHWYNQGYDCFEAFLATFTAEKRKKAKRERRRVAEAGIEFDTLHGGDMTAPLWNVVYEFYADTFYRHGHEPYLNLDFFKRISAAMPNELMLKVARMGREPIAVAIFFVGSEALYGRYWGAGGNFHSLHFEACYYQGIEYCIEKRLQRFEPGTQGEHKVPRGFIPTLTHSAHYIADPRFAAAIRDYAQREARGVDTYAAAVQSHVPYHRTPDEELRF
ncbi:MAG TPA: GNAT family N-acetyltransferase [Steroidobacteraceae bacterium]|nr:GNAT family N-acetyltransferase [Steroidobacteraceae bacterium]